MIQGNCYSFSYPTKSASSRNLIPSASGPWKEESNLHVGDPDYGRDAEEGRRILFMDPTRQNDEKEDDRGDFSIVFEKEHMFDKVVTPSDVGKLNRLVIPKQHAEKYFPLDSSNCEKSLLLNFEDQTGKPWRFRYSYWNSSQSYVMTKGWSRFVKEMKLDAGDIVSFQRGIGDLGKDRLFIDWRRRTHMPVPHPVERNHLHLFPGHVSFGHSIPLDLPASQDYLWFSRINGRPNHPHQYSLGSPVGHIYDYGYGETPMVVPTSNYGAYDTFYHRSSCLSPYMGRGQVNARRTEPPVPIYESVPIAQGKAAAATKRFRLFGVNMECATSDSNGEDNLQPPPPPDLMLYDGVPVVPKTRFVSRGKASMSLDLDL